TPKAAQIMPGDSGMRSPFTGLSFSMAASIVYFMAAMRKSESDSFLQILFLHRRLARWRQILVSTRVIRAVVAAVEFRSWHRVVGTLASSATGTRRGSRLKFG